jgi:putative phosphoribosyl transferase
MVEEIRIPARPAVLGGRDEIVIELNQKARAQMRCEVKLEIGPGATHLFEEPGTLQHVAQLASNWFVDHIKPKPTR